MNKHTLTLLAAAMLAAACAQTSPGWESRFGDAARQAAALQVIDPAAPSREGAARLDGKAMAGAMRGYANGMGYSGSGGSQPGMAATPTPGAK